MRPCEASVGKLTKALGSTALAAVALALLALALVTGSPPQTSAEQTAPLCMTPHPMAHTIVLSHLCRGVGGISSRYVITNPTEGYATTLHSFCTNEHDLVTEQPDGVPIEPYDSRLYHLAKMTDLPSGYKGYAVVQSDWAITGAVLPPPFTVFLPIVIRSES
jgi:hypothetical protein